ncbi:MAG: exopolysaccharide biosynthesis protein [Thermostichales cyanobacterium BF4_bins_65]
MPFSAQIQGLLADYRDRPLPLGVLLHRSGEQGFGLLSTVLTLPFLIFIPPGLSTMVALVVAMLGWQMGMGRREPWLPPRYARLELSPQVLHGVLKNLTRLLHPLERILRPRWFACSRHPLVRRGIGFSIAWCALLLAIPVPPVIPLTNIIPTVAIVTMALAVMEEDGLVMILGLAMAVGTTIYFALMAGLIVAAFATLWQRLISRTP